MALPDGRAVEEVVHELTDGLANIDCQLCNAGRNGLVVMQPVRVCGGCAKSLADQDPNDLKLRTPPKVWKWFTYKGRSCYFFKTNEVTSDKTAEPNGMTAVEAWDCYLTIENDHPWIKNQLIHGHYDFVGPLKKTVPAHSRWEGYTYLLRSPEYIWVALQHAARRTDLIQRAAWTREGNYEPYVADARYVRVNDGRGTDELRAYIKLAKNTFDYPGIAIVRGFTASV